MKRPLLFITLIMALSLAVCAGDPASAKKIPAKESTGPSATAKPVDAKKTTTPQSDVAKPAASSKSENDTLTVIAQIMEIPGKFPSNDIYNYVYIMKYRVLSVTSGTYADREILIGHYNPLIPRIRIKDKMALVVKGNVEKFQIGDKHRLVLVKPVERFCETVESDYDDSDLEKYFALKADVAK